MRVYVFDYQGTLTILSDPVGFLRQLREQEAEARILLWTATPIDVIEQAFPGLREVVDDVRSKPEHFGEHLTALGWPVTEVVFSDDDVMLRQAVAGSLRVMFPKVSVRLVPPAGLPFLLGQRSLREMVRKVLEVPDITQVERTIFQVLLDANREGPLEGHIYPDVEAHVRGRFEWYYLPNGKLRRPI